MHLLVTQSRSLETTEGAVDLGQSPSDIACLSFSDSDLGALAAAAERREGAFSLRLASLQMLRHPYSVDLYLERTLARARFVLVRLLGGLDYWRYGVEELSRLARARGIALAIVPGDHREDARLDAASTLPVADLRLLWSYFQHGGARNLGALLGWIEARLGASTQWSAPEPLPAAGLYDAAHRRVAASRGSALITFYRANVLADDCAPIVALADALAARGLDVEALHVTSLKDPEAADAIARTIAALRPDVVLNTTAFSGRGETTPSPLDAADAPVIQAILAGADEAQWRADPRGLGPADLAMNVVLPEMDGRIVGTVVSCKAESPRSDALEFTRLVHRPVASRIAQVAELAAAWVRLRRRPRAERRLAMVLSDYPGRAGRTGYAVGLDTPASVAAIASDLREAGYRVGGLPNDLMRALAPSPPAGDDAAWLTLEDYRALFENLPDALKTDIRTHWGEPHDDPGVHDGAFAFPVIRAGHLLVALQPDRGSRTDRKGEYHDTARAPRHAYVAFYLWLRHRAGIDALIHCGTHGTLEWLPGKAAALDASCAPEALLGPTPLVYPFIVNNPGEAAQAKRRTAAVTIGHMTPPLVEAGAHGAALEIEALFDEYAAAQTLDPKRAAIIARTLLERSRETGLAAESGIDLAQGAAALPALDAWLCDVKEMRITDGLHVFGRVATAPASHEDDAACAAGERAGLIAALDGRFVAGGPAGAPSRGRRDVLPTGRNLYGTDPRAVPTRTAAEIGRRAADAIAERYAQDHGDWPRALVLDLWASATMRTGGEDLAQAFAHLGVRPRWDAATTRVAGFEILPFAALERPRVDVTLRISGLFRDVFPGQIALFDEAVRALAALEEDDEVNPLAAARRRGEATARVFGAAPGVYGIGLGRRLDADPDAAREDLGRDYLDAAAYAYGGARAAGQEAPGAFAERVAAADAFVHVQDMADLDLLSTASAVEAEAGFAAAARALGGTPALYHLDAASSDRLVARTQAEEIARVVRARAANPRWIAGQMRHGHRGAAEIAETLDNLYAMAVMSDAVESRHFDLVFAATLGADAVRAFLRAANPEATRAMAQRFRDAARRGLWTSRRNSDAATLAEILEAA